MIFRNDYTIFIDFICSYWILDNFNTKKVPQD